MPGQTALRHLTFLILSFLLFPGCREEPRQYLFLGHAYDWNDTARVDPRIEGLDLAAYDQIWLGGDVCSRTGRPGTLAYLDSLFDLDAPGTHLVMGNHEWDYGDPSLIPEWTRRPTFYTDWVDGICLLVLNTNLFWYYPVPPPQTDCARKQAQVDLIQKVTDTVKQASHLVILHHHGLLTERKQNEQGQPIEAFNVDAAPITMSCDSTATFTEVVYPWLRQVQSRGVQVVLIGGDVGMRAKTFALRTPEGIQLLGSGINNSVNRDYAPDYVTNFDPDSILVLEYRPGSGGEALIKRVGGGYLPVKSSKEVSL